MDSLLHGLEAEGKLVIVVFLDFDGVLNDEAYLLRSDRDEEPGLSMWWWAKALDPALVELLNGLLERTGAKVVVSSSWRVGASKEWLQSVLESRGFKGEVIDVTPRSYGCNRSDEIEAWLLTHEVESFVILDDDERARIEGRFVRTSMKVGLTRRHIEKAEAILIGKLPTIPVQ